MRSDDRGSALMLVPAGVLVLVMLGAIAVDSAVVLLAQRALADRTAGAANDIAASLIVEHEFYRAGVVRLSSEEAERYAGLAFAPSRRPPGYAAWGADASTSGDRSVVVSAWADVTYVFAKALPGFPDSARVTAESVATARGG